MRLLVVEDDKDLNKQLTTALEKAGYVVDSAFDGEEGLFMGESEPYDAVVLDLGLPKIDGIAVLTAWRNKDLKIPVLILTARDTVTDRVTGLDSGANDYISKPFELLELEARIRALLRKEQWGNMTKIVVGGLEFDTVERRATINGDNLDLSARELAVLEQLFKSVGKVVNKVQLIRNLSSWDAELSHNALEIIMHRLRKKLEKTGINVRTVRGLGYMLEKPA